MIELAQKTGWKNKWNYEILDLEFKNTQGTIHTER